MGTIQIFKSIIILILMKSVRDADAEALQIN